MSFVLVRDLALNQELDSKSMTAVRGGNSWPQGLGPVADVNVNVSPPQCAATHAAV